jgi:hypothetical protein
VSDHRRSLQRFVWLTHFFFRYALKVNAKAISHQINETGVANIMTIEQLHKISQYQGSGSCALNENSVCNQRKLHKMAATGKNSVNIAGTIHDNLNILA